MKAPFVPACFISVLSITQWVNGQQIVSLNGATASSGVVSGRLARFATDGKDFPDAPNAFFETNANDYNWIQITLPTGYQLSQVVLKDGNFANKGEFNTNLMVTASNDPADFSGYNQGSDPVAFLTGAGLKYQRLNPVSGDESKTQVNTGIGGKIVRIWDMDGGGIRLAEIKIYGGGNVPPASMNSGNSSSLSGGPSIVVPTGAAVAATGTDEKIRQAISKKDNAALATLLKEEPESFTQQHVDDAFANGQVEQGTKITSVTGIKPSAQKSSNSGYQALPANTASGSQYQQLVLMDEKGQPGNVYRPQASID